MPADHPTALLRPAPRGRLLFLTVLILAVIACAVLLWWRSAAGHRLHIMARDAHGLEVHDPVRYRGIDIGQVVAIGMDPQRAHVRIDVRLTSAYADLARAGTRFWIERPRIDWERVGGLDTIVGTRYLACSPGDGPPQDRFVALAEAPVDVPPDALLFRLQGEQRDGLHRGAPVSHRGLIIGRVSEVGLSSDARWVEASAYVTARYRHLLLTSSRFCPAGGIELEAGLTGVALRLPPLAQLGQGGVALVNTGGGDSVQPGHRYRLQSRDLLAEVADQPPVAIGQTTPALPPVRELRLQWVRPRSFWWDGSGSRSGLGVPFRGGLLAPASLAQAPESATEVVLRVDGDQQQTVDPSRLDTIGTGLLHLPLTRAGTEIPWRAPVHIEDALVRIDSGRALALAAASLLAGADGWHLPTDFPTHLLSRGAPVIANADQALIGLIDADPWRVVPLPAAPD